jgi:hypothetical protein
MSQTLSLRWRWWRWKHHCFSCQGNVCNVDKKPWPSQWPHQQHHWLCQGHYLL